MTNQALCGFCEEPFEQHNANAELKQARDRADVLVKTKRAVAGNVVRLGRAAE